jgi:hypothetical protein
MTITDAATRAAEAAGRSRRCPCRARSDLRDRRFQEWTSTRLLRT